MDERQDTDRDDLLDRMLAAYGEVEPPVGLETRVLGEINQTLTRRRRRVWLLFAGPALATAAALLLLFSRHADHPNLPSPLPISSVANVGKREIDSGPPPQIQPEQRHSVKVNSDRQGFAKPRQSTFPSPSAPSDQERALLSLMQADGGALVASALFPPGTNVDGPGIVDRSRFPQ